MAKKILGAIGKATGIGGIVGSILGGKKQAAASDTASTSSTRSGPIIKQLGGTSSNKAARTTPLVARSAGQATILRNTLGGD
jgi:hypothetical protein